MRTLRLLLLALLAALILGATVLPAAAQTPTPNQINEVAHDLWCPLCNGVRLDNCELQACVQMREVISEQLAAGVSKDQIKAYFVTQYGDVVLGAPSTSRLQPAGLVAAGVGGTGGRWVGWHTS